MSTLTNQKGFITPGLILFCLVIIFASFYIGTQFSSRTNQSTPTVEAKGRNIFESYADCAGYKLNNTDITPPTVSITKPLNEAVISGITGNNDIVWVDIKSVDDNGYTYPSLYVNGVFNQAYLNMVTNTQDPTIKSGYIHVRPNKTYTLTAKACDTGGNEAWSVPVKFSTQ